MKNKFILLIYLLGMLTVLFSGCEKKATGKLSMENFNDKRLGIKAGSIYANLTSEMDPNVTQLEFQNNPDLVIGVETGTVFEEFIHENFPNATISYFNNVPDMVLALKASKIDAFVTTEPSVKYAIAQDSEIKQLGDTLDADDYAFVLAQDKKGEALKKELDAYLKTIKENGVLEEIDSIWFGADEEKKVIDMPSLNNQKTLTMAVVPTDAPFTYYKDGKIVGYTIDMAARFCKEYGYNLKIEGMDFSAVLSGVKTGKYDLAGGMIAITPERAKSVLFSEPTYKGGTAIAVRNDSKTVSVDDTQSVFTFLNNALSDLKESFEKTFIEENRYKLIFQGILVTLIISIGAILLGSILGFGICMLRSVSNKLCRGIAIVYIRLLQGTPIVVFLMIMYYIVFGNTEINAIWVAIIGFAMNLSAYVSEMIRSGIEAVDKGQIEAAKALGFNSIQVFMKIVMPQASKHFLPVYKGEIISLVKSTSVVGYIAIQDLTKMSDIIRSRTYEAFFPLIATAIIYFILTYLLTLILNYFMKKLEPIENKKPKGVIINED